jgi:outer membrane protein TolC
MTLLEFLDFERALLQAEIGRIDARLDAVHAYADFTAIIANASPVSGGDTDNSDPLSDIGN